ncbi:hypothetical protein ACLKA6_011517 [Drosophila palustris]
MTKSITRLRLRLRLRTSSSFSGILFTYVILACTSVAFSSPPSCGLYGAPPCQFLPAPPGQTPNCARPGKTYCEHVDNYPTYLIKSLVRKWGYEAASLLVDETWEEFTSVTSVFYDPKYIFPQRDFGNGQDFNGYSYQTPFGGVPHRGAGNSLFAPHPTTEASTHPTYLLYTSAGQRQGNQHQHQHQHQQPAGSSGSASTQLYYNNAGKTPYNATLWLKRLARDLSLRQKAIQATAEQLERELAEQELAKQELASQQQGGDEEGEGEGEGLTAQHADNNSNTKKTKTHRTKRQSSNRSTLCETTSQFVTPQAALNSRGNWMFVVNEENTARQMVKAELCASNTCSNLCDLPNGYNSRCEQKFVQKRLIALQGNGQNLYTDTFWFPSCCVCTIAAN